MEERSYFDDRSLKTWAGDLSYVAAQRCGEFVSPRMIAEPTPLPNPKLPGILPIELGADVGPAKLATRATWLELPTLLDALASMEHEAPAVLLVINIAAAQVAGFDEAYRALVRAEQCRDTHYAHTDDHGSTETRSASRTGPCTTTQT